MWFNGWFYIYTSWQEKKIVEKIKIFTRGQISKTAYFLRNLYGVLDSPYGAESELKFFIIGEHLEEFFVVEHMVIQ